MLGGARLRKRLDRAFHKMEDFEVSAVRMVGTTPVLRADGSPETYSGRNPYNDVAWTRPVLPSDHFGLLVTLKPRAERSVKTGGANK
jgi:hypothetical protein|mmetsp:Transcript_41004/g.65738  ORF Transcript_41004/g.65738 Transcript_41004/m.65738 type:complete len:87 (+) Transcript_41004:111-371(+)